MAPPAERVAVEERTLLAVASRVGEQAQVAARAATHTAIAGVLLGGVLVAPVLALFALAVLITPQLVGVRRMAPALIFVSLLWLALAILGAHMQMEHAADYRSDEGDSDASSH